VLVTPDPLIAPVGHSSTVVNRTWTAAGAVLSGAVTGPVNTEALLWVKGVGWRKVIDILTGTGLDLTGWFLETTTVVSADGKTLTGVAWTPNGRFVRWYAELP
jgi:hypothetical protein